MANSIIAAVVSVHLIAVISWLGAMYFNLFSIFPMYRSRGLKEYGELMAEQGTRAVWLLYCLIGLTFVSGLVLSVATRTWETAPQRLGFKVGLWALMLGSHLIGTLRIWPKVFFAVPSEFENLFFRYRCWMAVSAAAGSLAVLFSVASRFGY